MATASAFRSPEPAGGGPGGEAGSGCRPVTGTDTKGHRLQDRTSNPALSALLPIALSSYLPQLTRACRPQVTQAPRQTDKKATTQPCNLTLGARLELQVTVSVTNTHAQRKLSPLCLESRQLQKDHFAPCPLLLRPAPGQCWGSFWKQTRVSISTFSATGLGRRTPGSRLRLAGRTLDHHPVRAGCRSVSPASWPRPPLHRLRVQPGDQYQRAHVYPG